MPRSHPKIEDLPGFSPSILERYKRIVLLNPERGEWSQQSPVQYDLRTFPRNKFRKLSDREIALMLWQYFWLACIAPADGHTDRIVFDLDARDADEEPERNRRYEHIRAVFGVDRTPLVYRTPSGHGIRVAYRVPTVPLSRIIEGRSKGLVADVLRGAGLDVADGEIEVYPQVSRPDRLPLGRRMPILDASTLGTALPEIPDGAFDLDHLLASLAIMEAWHHAPETDLLDDLQSKPRLAIGVVDRVQMPGGLPHAAPTADPKQFDTGELFNVGLTSGGQRQRAEFAIGVEFAKNPNRYGLPQPLANHQLADAIAFWLSQRHNGRSADWNRALVRHGGDVEETIRYFADTYLAPNSKGQSAVDRIFAAAASGDRALSRTVSVSGKEAQAIFGLAERTYLPGVLRYRFEVWLFGWLYHVKNQVLRELRNGTAKTNHVRISKRLEEVWIVEISTRWMRHEWPYGNGENARGEVRYAEFLRVLDEAGVMRRLLKHKRRGTGGATRDTAARYAVPFRVADLDVRVRDLPADPLIVRRAIEATSGVSSSGALAHAMHALYATDGDTSRSALVARYHRSSADRILRMARALRAAIAELNTKGEGIMD